MCKQHQTSLYGIFFYSFSAACNVIFTTPHTVRRDLGSPPGKHPSSRFYGQLKSICTWSSLEMFVHNLWRTWLFREVRVLPTPTVDGQVAFGPLFPSAPLQRLCLALDQVPHCNNDFPSVSWKSRAGKGGRVRAGTCILFALRFWRMF